MNNHEYKPEPVWNNTNVPCFFCKKSQRDLIHSIPLTRTYAGSGTSNDWQEQHCYLCGTAVEPILFSDNYYLKPRFCISDECQQEHDAYMNGYW